MNWERTARKPEDLILKSLRLKSYSRSSILYICAFKNSRQKSQKTSGENVWWKAKSKRTLVDWLTIYKNGIPPQTIPRKHRKFQEELLKERLWGAATRVLTFQQFDLEIRYFNFNFRRFFLHITFKTVTLTCIFLEFVEMFFHNAGPLLKLCT